MTIKIGTLAHGARGFDCNEPVSAADARRFWDAGYRFAVRYVRGKWEHSYDLTAGEIVTLLNAGLAVMVVQHVQPPGWSPSLELGQSYGAIAAEEARRAGIPRGVTIWCDLEGVSYKATGQEVIQFCNAWYDAVRLAGFDAGLYVGYEPGLTGEQLYWKLKFRRYWSGYNLNQDLFPAVRGVCMWQGAYPSALTDAQYAERVRRAKDFPPHKQPHRRVPGIAFQYDTDVVERDGFNNLPMALLPGDPG